MEKEKELVIYFLYILEKDKKREITSYFPLEIINSKIDEKENIYKINLYKIIVDKSELKEDQKKLKIQLVTERENNNKETDDYSIDISDNNHKNIYLYDIAFEYQHFLSPILSPHPPQNIITIKEKYEIFKSLNKNELDEDLIYFTQKKIETEKQYNFSFFVSVLNDIKKKEDLEKHCELFNINKVIFDDIIIKDFFDDKKIKELINILILNKELSGDKLNNYLLLILSLLFQYDRNIIDEIISTILKYIKKSKALFKILLKYKNKKTIKIFSELKLSGFIIDYLIRNANTYQDILDIISYNKIFLETLEIIIKNFGLIKDLKTKNEIEERINLHKLIIPNKADDLNEIRKYLGYLFNIEDDCRCQLVDISPDLLEEYYNYNENNIDQLICLFQIIKMILNKNKNKLKFHKIASIVYKKLEDYALERKLNNMNLISFIENISVIPNYRRNLNRKILNNIEIDKINYEFIRRFRAINWLELLVISKLEFIKQICELITNIKYFGKIFLIFDFNEAINMAQMNIISKRFIQLLDTYEEKECENIVNDCSKLVYFINIKKCDLKSFNDYCYGCFSPNIIHQIYCDICSSPEYKIYNDELKNSIKEFYNQKENKNLNKSIFFAFEILHNENFNPDDLKSYYIEYKDFFDIKNEQNYKISFLEIIFEKQLLDNKMLIDYLGNVKKELKVIINKIKDGTVDYKNIKIFFENNNSNELKKRIEISLKLLDEYEDNKNLYNQIEQKINDINKTIKNLKNIERKMNIYLTQTKKEEIIEIKDILNEIEELNLDYYLLNQEQINKFLTQSFFLKLPSDYEKNNFFFKYIYKEEKAKSKDEMEIINNTFSNIRNLIKIMSSNHISHEKINYLSIIINELTEEEYCNIKTEINNLTSIVEEKNELEGEKIIKTIKYIWEKDIIYNISIIFKFLLEKKELKMTAFSSVNNVICKYLEATRNINIIKISVELYKNYNIEFNGDKNFELFKRIKFAHNFNEIAYYIFNIEIEQLQNKLKEYEDKNLFEYFYIKGELNKIIIFKGFIDSILSSINDDTRDKHIVNNFWNELNNSKEYQEGFIALIGNFEVIKEVIKIIE